MIRIRNLLGTDNYMASVGYLVRLWKSLFLRIEEPGVELVRHFIPKGGTVFDIGANIGRFTTFAASLVGRQGQVYSFEPLKYPRRVLRHMLVLRRLRQVSVVDVALSNQPGDFTMTIPLKKGKPQTSFGYLGNNFGEDAIRETVHVETLDGFCAVHNIQRLDFIKCDVEGFEYYCFLGGRATLERFKPGIYCEVDPKFYANKDIRVATLFTLMKELGYRWFLPNTNGSRLAEAHDQLAKTDKLDYFFIHESKLHEEGLRLAMGLAPAPVC